MITDEWTYQIERQLPFVPTTGQHEAVLTIAQFLADRSTSPLMLLRGSAGTGKTSVARAVVRAMMAMHQKVELLAPTGRAAKVFANGTGYNAYTIHRRIYRQQSYLSGAFSLNDNMHTDTLFMVDEASMINHIAMQEGGGASFGSGSLLDDLVRYVCSGRNCRLMLIGDTAQLPPVGADEAPALVTDFMAGYGMSIHDYDLTEVLRQSQQSGILSNATMIRQMITHDEMTQLPLIHFTGFADITICMGNELIEQLADSYYHVGNDETIVITRSNKRANVYNLGIRNQVLDYDDELGSGDQLMIVKNNYFWTNDKVMGDGCSVMADTTANHSKTNSQHLTPNTQHPSFIANGDRCIVKRVRNIRELYGFRFADVSLEFPDYPIMDENGKFACNYELDSTIILDTLQSEAPALTREQQEQLYNNVIEDYFDVPLKADKIKHLRSDIYFNALQVKYAYAVTCHKAQGGQWAHVYVDQGYMTDEMLTPSYIHWLYTAFTRATEHLYLVNWPKTQVSSTTTL